MQIYSKLFRSLTLSIVLLIICATATVQAEDASKTQTPDSMMNMMNPAMYMNMMGPMMNPAMYMNMMGPMMGMMAPFMNPMTMMNPSTTSGGYNTNSMGQMMDPKEYENWFNQWTEMMKSFTPEQKQ